MRTTLCVVADLAESVGVPSSVTSIFQCNEGAAWSPPEADPAPAVEPKTDTPVEAKATKATAKAPAKKATAKPAAGKPAAGKPAAGKPAAGKPAAGKPAAGKPAAGKPAGTGSNGKTRKRASKKRVVEGNKAKSANVRALQVDDEIKGSTYLARIIWSLGVSQLEGLGPLRPADIARMVMSRSPVSLEPPNVARYIRRSKPTCIVIAQKEGSSSFYKLNAEGKKLFDDLFTA
ncbi:MAG: hypothetical protein JRH20_07620 [Deltaproteobacteria bacterium]|nr:hypothetical protein [Deltaproteobacteria bacterium]